MRIPVGDKVGGEVRQEGQGKGDDRVGKSGGNSRTDCGMGKLQHVNILAWRVQFPGG